MPNKNYEKGRAFEYKLMHMLKKKGYQIVIRTAGSHSPYDVIGIKNGTLCLFQLKAKELTLKEQYDIMESFPKIPKELDVKQIIVFKLKGKTVGREV